MLVRFLHLWLSLHQVLLEKTKANGYVHVDNSSHVLPPQRQPTFLHEHTHIIAGSWKRTPSVA